jgi:phosphoribosyl-ATP pyrophosphohydrolase
MKLDYEKMNGLIPTIIQDEEGTVISLVYSNKESISKTLETRKVCRYSRQRKQVCMKGETSGNFQEFISVKKDCDNDALLYIVKQTGNGGCHTGNYSCFGEERKFSLNALYNKIAERGKSNDENSYTAKLFADENLLKRKLVEEAAEVITAKDKKELVWECADLCYFLFTIMAKNGITIKDLEKENGRRNNK